MMAVSPSIPDIAAAPEPLRGSELPVLGTEPHERADAARNRRRILAAAGRLFAERSVDCVSMDEIADAARVGKGTLFRRFGDRASLMWAVLDEGERAFQEAFIRGAEPRGAGAASVSGGVHPRAGAARAGRAGGGATGGLRPRAAR